MLPPSLEDKASVQISRVPSAGGTAHPRVGSIGVELQIPCKTQSSGETELPSYLIDPHLFWTKVADVCTKASTASEVC